MTALAHDEEAWARTLSAIEKAYRLRKPDAHASAMAILRKIDLTTAGLQKKNTPHGVKLGIAYAERSDALRHLIDEVSTRQTLKNDDTEHGTPETELKPAQTDPILRLHAVGAIGNAELDAANEIRRVYEAMTRRLSVSARNYVDMVAPKAGKRPGGGMPQKLAEIHAEVYLPWAKQMTDGSRMFYQCRRCLKRVLDSMIDCHDCGPGRVSISRPCLPLVLDIVIDGEAIDTAMRRHRMGTTKANFNIASSLALYVTIKRG